MINIGIVEDNEQAAAAVKEHLARYSQEKSCEFNVAVYSSAGKFLGASANYCDIVFMDIELPDGNGMELVRRMRQSGNDVIVIFITNLAQYAVKGYEVRAFDFIVKPIKYYNFAAKLSSALDYLESKSEKYVWVTSREKKTRLSASNIRYVEIRSHTLIYHTSGGDITATGSLSKTEEQLAGLPFALCNRCFLVNLKFVTTVKDMSVFLGDEELQISHTKRAAFMKALTDYCAAL